MEKRKNGMMEFRASSSDVHRDLRFATTSSIQHQVSSIEKQEIINKE